MEISLSEHLQSILSSLPALLPEIGLAVGFLVVILLDLITHRSAPEWKGGMLWTATLMTCLLIAMTTFLKQGLPTEVWPGWLIHDGLAVFGKGLCLLTAVLVLFHAQSLQKNYPTLFTGEFFALLLGLLLGLFLMVMSANLLMVYLSIELVSLSSYALSTFRQDARGAEGGMKYLLFGAVSSGVMLYGMSLLYGMTGTLHFTHPDFAESLGQIPLMPLMLAGLLTMGGFLFKISAIPFHFWTPDVYQAAPTPVVAFFSVAPKAAALIIFLRFLAGFPTLLLPTVAALAIGSMVVGNFSALWQKDGKRMLAYSSIAHAGFMMVGLVAVNDLAWRSLAFYLATYLFLNLAAFFLLDLAAHGTPAEEKDFYAMERLKGLGLQKPLVGIALLLVMVGLAGLPPTAGFTAKLFIFSSLWEAYQSSHLPWQLALFIVGLLNAVVSLFYYLKIPFYLFFRSPSPFSRLPFELTGTQKMLTAWVVLPILLFFFKADWLMNFIAGLTWLTK